MGSVETVTAWTGLGDETLRERKLERDESLRERTECTVTGERIKE